MPAVRRAGSPDIAQLSLVFSSAFRDDPVFEHLFGISPGADARRRRFFELTLPILVGRGFTYVPDGDVVAGAVWAPPDRWRVRPRESVRSVPGLLSVFGLRGLRHLWDYERLERIHAEHREPHFYLAVLGTEPAHQGRGWGSALLEPVLEQCDREGLGAYLESSKESNLAFYRRHGFEVERAHEFHPGGPTVWPMWRPPR